MWASLHQHSSLSLLDGLSKPINIVEKAVRCGIPAIALTDHGTLSGIPIILKAKKKFIEQCEDEELKERAKLLKIILGQEFYINNGEGKPNSHLVVLAKNLEGWKSLIRASSDAHNKENFYRKPRLTIEQFQDYSKGNLIAFSGHLGSDLANIMFSDIKAIYKAKTYEEAKSIVNSNWKKDLLELTDRYVQIFGKNNFFLESQLIDQKNLPAATLVVNTLRWLSKKTGLKCVATADSHYVNREDNKDQWVILVSAMKTTIPDVQKALEREDDDIGLSGFFKSNNYHIPSPQEIQSIHTEDELKTSLEIAESIENYDIFHKPMFRKFDCPDGLDSNEYLKKLCREGWVDKIQGMVEKEERGKYGDRVKYELEILCGAGLSDYFLTLVDIVKYIKSNGRLVGEGRGCLSGDVPIYIRNGICKNISDIKINDYVLTIDGSYKKVINKFEYEINPEEMLNIKCYFGDSNGVSLTKDHKVLSYVNNKLIWLESKNLKNNDWVYVAKPNRIINDIDFIDMSNYCEKDDKLSFDDNYVYQKILINKSDNKVKRIKKSYRFIKVDNDFCKLIGYFTGDGCLRKSQNYNVYFSFNNNQLKDISFVKNILLKYGFEISEREQKKTHSYQIIVNSKLFYNLIKTLFHKYESTSISKHVPDIIFGLSENKIKSYLLGCMLSDGHFAKTFSTYKTISKNLSEQIRFLFWSINIPSSISSYKPKDKRCIINNIVYTICLPKNPFSENFSSNKFKIIKNGFLLKIRKISTIIYNKVYDIEVQNNHNYSTSSFLVHNSAAGCLTSYLLGLTGVDPIKYDLIFERFYNDGRNTKDKINLPDFDLDIEANFRDPTIDYIKLKYGEENVAQIGTFGRLMGRACLKEVLRAWNVCDSKTMDKITKFIPDESAIADDLQEMKEEEGESSIIMWSLENNSKELKDWCYLDDEKKCKGPYAKYFEQAMRIEGTYKSAGKHAAGVIISPIPLVDIVPTRIDRSSGKKIADVDMHAIEDLGLVKMDILASKILDKINLTQQDICNISLEELNA